MNQQSEVYTKRVSIKSNSMLVTVDMHGVGLTVHLVSMPVIRKPVIIMSLLHTGISICQKERFKIEQDILTAGQ